MILLLISVIIFVSYISYIYIRYGEQRSISDSYYRLKSSQRILFTMALWGFALPIGIVSNTLLLFLAISAICFVGAAAAFNSNEITYKVHMVSAYSGIIMGLTSLVFDYHMYWYTLGTVITMAIAYFTLKNKIWWIEIVAFISIWIAIMKYKIF